VKNCSNKVEKLCQEDVDFLNADHRKVGKHPDEAEELGEKSDNAVKEFPKNIAVKQETADHESDKNGIHNGY
jgi:hypothetical protein